MPDSPFKLAVTRLVLVESPYAGDISRNVQYAKEAMLDCLRRGGAPVASHLLSTQVLDDSKPEERRLGIDAGLAWGEKADATVVYTDHGVSPGMMKGIERAVLAGRPVEYRSLRQEIAFLGEPWGGLEAP